MQIQRYPLGQVPLQGGPTQAPASYQTPVADAIGQAAGVASEFAQKYQQAKYATDATELELEIKRKTNAYFENLRVNPIQQVLGEDIVQTKEDDWNKFSQSIGKYIDSISNRELSENYREWWLSKSEDGRSNVVENAIDENIAYMGDKQQDRINELVELGEWRDARTAARVGEDSGFWGREQEDDIFNYIQRREHTAEALQMSYPEGVQHIKQQDMPSEEKAKALEVLRSTEEERLRQEKEALKATQEQNLESGFYGISTQNILTMPQLDSMLAPGGKYDALDASQGQRLRTALRTNMNKRDQGINNDDIVDDYMKAAFLTNDRSIVKGTMYDLQLKMGMSPTMMNKYGKLLESDTFPAMNERVMAYSEEQFSAMAKEGMFGEEPTDIANAKARMFGRIYDFQNDPSLSERDRAMEKGFTMEDAERFFYNEKQAAAGFDMSKVKTLYSLGGDRLIDTPERFLQAAESGELYGQTDQSVLGEFVLDASMSPDQLRERTSVQYGDLYKDLTKDQKAQVNLTVSYGQFLRLTEDLFKTMTEGRNIDGAIGIDQNTGLPVVSTIRSYTDHNGIEQLERRDYRLEYNEYAKEEEWKYYNTFTNRWESDPLMPIPSLSNQTAIERTIQSTKDAYIKLRDLDPEPIGESARILEEHQASLEEELKAEEGTVLGNIFKDIGRRIFSGRD